MIKTVKLKNNFTHNCDVSVIQLAKQCPTIKKTVLLHSIVGCGQVSWKNRKIGHMWHYP